MKAWQLPLLGSEGSEHPYTLRTHPGCKEGPHGGGWRLIALAELPANNQHQLAILEVDLPASFELSHLMLQGGEKAISSPTQIAEL